MRVDASQLLRIVVNNQAVTIDRQRVLPGRGAWLHDKQACLTAAVQRGSVVRALRAPDNIDMSAITNYASRTAQYEGR